MCQHFYNQFKFIAGQTQVSFRRKQTFVLARDLLTNQNSCGTSKLFRLNKIEIILEQRHLNNCLNLKLFFLNMMNKFLSTFMTRRVAFANYKIDDLN